MKPPKDGWDTLGETGEGTGELVLLDCGCGDPKCNSVKLCMVNPVIRDIYRPDGKAIPSCVLYLPADQAKGFLKAIRDMFKEKGYKV